MFLKVLPLCKLSVEFFAEFLEALIRLRPGGSVGTIDKVLQDDELDSEFDGVLMRVFGCQEFGLIESVDNFS